LIVRAILALAALACAAPLAAQTPRGTNPDRPSVPFSGCDAVGAEIRNQAPGRAAPRRTEDPLTRREFAGGSRDEVVASNAGEEALVCWSRIDGLWQEDVTIALDKSYPPVGWASLSPGLETLASGLYTMPRQLVIEVPENMGDSVLVRLWPDFERTLVYRSDDGVPLGDVLRRGSPSFSTELASSGHRCRAGRTTGVGRDRSVPASWPISLFDAISAWDRFAGYEMQLKTCTILWRTLAGSLVWRCGLRR
jgi:hypothetical protein